MNVRRFGPWLGFVAWAFLALPVAAQEPPNVTVNVVREGASATIFVNGVPIHRADWDPANAGTPVTDAVSTGMWLVEGDNDIAVEARAVDPAGYVEVTVLRSFDEPYLLEQRIEGDGRAELTLPVEGGIAWTFVDAEPWSGDTTDLMAAVAALHDAAAQHDVGAFMAAHTARNDDFTLVFGPMPPEMMAQLEQALASQTLQPLGDLVATPFLDGRVWHVVDGAGHPPIVLIDTASPDSRLETGEFWIRRDGTWQIVR